MKIEYPTTYIVWDLETSGLIKEKCKILEIGYMKVHEGEVVERKNWILDNKIDISEEITGITGIDNELIYMEGIEPKVAMSEFLNVLLEDQDMAHLTHNGMRFDIDWLAYHMAKTLEWSVGDHSRFYEKMFQNAIDTAVFMKAGKLGMKRKWNETYREYTNRVMNTFAKGVKYNVKLCCEEFGIDMNNITLHRALGDCEMTHQIYKHLITQTK